MNHKLEEITFKIAMAICGFAIGYQIGKLIIKIVVICSQ